MSDLGLALPGPGSRIYAALYHQGLGYLFSCIARDHYTDGHQEDVTAHWQQMSAEIYKQARQELGIE